MSDHDALASHAMSLKREIEQYIDEYDPKGAATALELIDRLVIAIDKFPEPWGER